jgi:hypothetical protein
MFFQFISHMFTSVVAHDRCQLFCVERTDLFTYDVCRVDGPPSDYITATQHARDAQELFDPEYEYCDYRVAMCS